MGSGFWTGRAWLTVGGDERFEEEELPARLLLVMSRTELAQYRKERYSLRREARSRLDKALFPTEIGFEWQFGHKARVTHFTVETGSGSLKLQFGLWGLFALWFKVGQPWLRHVLWQHVDTPTGGGPDGTRPGIRVVHDWTEHEIVSVSWHDGCIWWSFFHPAHSWTSGTPAWRNHTFHVSDWVLGKPAYSKETLETRDVLVPLPERSYRATAELEMCSWRRRFGTLRRRFVEIKMADGEEVPIPGKGENSWDCEQDATFSTHMQADTIEEAIGRFVGSTLQTRQRRGGSNWVPEVRGAQPSSHEEA